MKCTFKYSLANCLCSSNTCLDRSLFRSGGAGLKFGSSIKCTDAKSSSSSSSAAVFCGCCGALLLASESSLVDVVTFDVVLVKFVVFIVFSILLVVSVCVLLEVDAIALDFVSVVDSLSLLWLLATNEQREKEFQLIISEARKMK